MISWIPITQELPYLERKHFGPAKSKEVLVHTVYQTVHSAILDLTVINAVKDIYTFESIEGYDTWRLDEVTHWAKINYPSNHSKVPIK